MMVWHVIWARLSRSNDTVMDHSSRRHYSETISLQFRDQFRPWPISARILVSLIDIGWSDNRIACYFGVEPVKVSALRAYYGLVDQAQDS
jgi:hypothetical protein